jgi:hypothetical protein
MPIRPWHMIIAYGRGKMSSFIKKYPELFKRVSEYNVREASGAQKYLCNLPPPASIVRFARPMICKACQDLIYFLPTRIFFRQLLLILVTLEKIS